MARAPAPAGRRSTRSADPLLRLVLAWLGAVLIGWPAIQIAGARGTVALFLYVFAIWGAIIVVLLIVSRSLRRSLPTTCDGNDRREPSS